MVNKHQIWQVNNKLRHAIISFSILHIYQNGVKCGVGSSHWVVLKGQENW